MENNTIPQWVQHFLQATYDMREAQKQYFSQPDNYRRKIAIGKETRVDEYLKKALASGVINTSKKSTEQSNLFK